MKQYIHDLHEHIQNNAIVYTPVSRSVVLPLKTAIEIIVTHEQRHLNQAKEVAGFIKVNT